MAVRLSDHFTYSKIFKAVISPIFMMVFCSLYCIVDGIFVANFAEPGAFAGINLIWPLVAILGGVGFMIGSGGSALVSKKLGEQEKEKADKYFSMMVYFTILVGFILAIACFFLIKPLAYAMASVSNESSQSMIDNAIIYGQILIAGIMTYMLQNLFQAFFVVAEKPNLGFIYTVLAGVTNFVLDFLLIAVFKLGVVGAAIATVAGQAVGGFLPIIYFLRHKNGVINLVKTKFEYKPIMKACQNGISEFISNVSSSIVGIVYNLQLLKYIGEDGVSAYGIMLYLQFVFIAIFIGYTIGISPIAAYNFGAKNHKELKNVLNKSLIIMTILGVSMVSISLIFARPLCAVFTKNDTNLLEISVNGMRIYSFSFLFCGMNIFISSFFTALNNGLVSGIVSLVRTLVLQLITVIVLPLIFGINGIWISIVIAEFLALILASILLYKNKKKYSY